MIFSILYTSRQSGQPIEFRGRKISFWISHRFKNLTFQEIADISFKDNFVLLFIEEKLIDTEPGFFLELAKLLKTRSVNDHAIYTIAGHPFYIVSAEILKNEGILKTNLQIRDILP